MFYEYRVKDGVCNTTDPRWALFVQGRSGRQYEVNLGCKVAPSSPGAQSGWIRKTFSRQLITAELLRKGGTDASTGQVTGLALVFDRSLGHVYVDNLRVIAKAANNTWTYAGDNGGTTPPGGAPAFTGEQVALLAAPGVGGRAAHAGRALRVAVPRGVGAGRRRAGAVAKPRRRRARTSSAPAASPRADLRGSAAWATTSSAETGTSSRSGRMSRARRRGSPPTSPARHTSGARARVCGATRRTRAGGVMQTGRRRRSSSSSPGR